MDESTIRILVVAAYYKPAYAYGGPVRSVSSSCEALTRLGAQVTVFTTNAGGAKRLDVPLCQPTDVDGVKVWYFPLTIEGFFFSPKLAQELSVQVASFDLAVLESLFGYPLHPGAINCLRSNVPYVVPPRGQLLPWSLGQKKWKKSLYLACIGRRYLNQAAALHCTDFIEAKAVTQLRFRAPVFVVPNGIEMARFDCLLQQGRIRRRYGIPPETQILLFLGRLHRKKRPDVAVQALAALPWKAHLVFAGPDEQGLIPLLMDTASRLGCAERVHFAGILKGDEVAHALRDADLLLMPSEPESENFGMAALEAMAAGVPVLVSEGVPVGRWAEQADAGRVVPCTAEAFSRSACELLSHPEQLKVMGQHGRQLVRECFDSSVVAKQMLAQYQAIIATGHPISGQG